MASDIASQLIQLRNRKNAATVRHGRPSVLFSYQEAADMDVEYLHGIAASGYEALCSLDDNYAKVGGRLFERKVLAVKPTDQQTKEERREWDEKIEKFLLLLSRHFLHQATFKVLEFLIRKFKINEHNVDSLMKCALPYHSTNEFVRLVQTLRLDGGIWYFLTKTQQSGAAVPRSILVTRCHTDPAILRFVCRTAEQAAVHKNRTWIAFTAALLCEYITQAKPAGESVVREVLPTILYGLNSPLHDCQAAAFLILTHLACVANLSQDFLAAVVDAVLKTCEGQEDTSHAVFMVLAKIASSQPSFLSLPASTLDRLTTLDSLTSNLHFLSERKVALSPLLTRVVSTLTASSSVVVQAKDKLIGIIHGVHLPDPVASLLADRLLSLASQTSSDEDQVHASLIAIFRTLDLRYSSQLDTVVNRHIKKARGSITKQSDSTNQDAMDIDSEEEGDADGTPYKSAHAQQLLDFIQSTFQHSMHSVLRMGDQVSTLALAIHAPAAQVRVMALQKLDQLTHGSNPGEADMAFVHSCILKSLEDDDLDVVQAALSAQTFPTLPFVAMLDAVSALLSKSWALLASSKSKSSQRVLVNAVKALSNSVVTHNPDRWPAAAAQLLAYSLSSKSTSKLAAAAVSGLQRITSSKCPALSVALEGAVKGAAEHGREDVAALSKTAVQTLHNAQVVESISSALRADAGLIPTLASLCPEAPRRAIHTILLSLNHCCSSAEQSQQLKAAAAIIQIATSAPESQLLSQIAAGDVSSSTAILDSRQLPTDDHTKQLGLQEAFAQMHKAVLAHALFQACAALGKHSSNKDGMEPRQDVPGTAASMDTPKSLFLQLTSLSSYKPLLPHLKALLPSLSQDPLQFLLDIITSPQPPHNPNVIECAVLLVPHALSPSASLDIPASSSKPLGTKTTYLAIAALLSCISHDSKPVRAAALDSLSVLAPTIATAKPGKSDSKSKSGVTSAPALVAEAINALLHHKNAIQKDSDTFMHLVRNSLPTLADESTGRKPAAATASGKKAGKKSRSKGGLGGSQQVVETAGAGGNEEGINANSNFLQSSIQLKAAPEALQALGHVMLQHVHLGLHVAALVVSCLRERLPHATLVQNVLPAFSTRVFSKPSLDQPETPSGVLTQSEAEAATQLVSFLFKDITLAVGKQPVAITYASLLSPPLQVASAGTVSLLRLAALRLLSPHLMAALSAHLQSHSLKQILQSATKDKDSSCQEAARTALQGLKITAETLTPLLSTCISSADSTHEPDVSREGIVSQTPPVKRRKSGSPGEDVEAPMGVSAALTHDVRGASPVDIELMIAALELLQWKSDVSDRPMLLPILANLLTAFLPLLAATADSAAPGQQVDSTDQEGAVLVRATSPVQGIAPYASQLALSAVMFIIKDSAGDESAAVSVGGNIIQQLLSLTLDVVSQAPDNATRTAALSLLSTIARHHPDTTVHSVLRVVRVASEASALVGEDPFAYHVASDALAAVVPAWLSCGREATGLWELVLDALPGMPSERRLSVLLVLLGAVPEEAGLAVGLELLVRDAAKAHEIEREQKKTSTPAGKSPGKTKKAKQGQEVGVSLDERPKSEWLLELAAGISSQVGVAERLHAFSQLLRRAVKAAGGKPSAPHSLLAAGFVSGQLKLAAMKASSGMSNGTVAAESAELKSIQGGCRALMEQALEHLRLLSQGKSTSADQAAVKVLYDIVRRLEKMMPPAGYVSALTELLSCQADKIQLQALKLLSTKLTRLAEEIAADAGAGEEDATKHESAKHQKDELVECAMGVCPHVTALLEATGPAPSAAASSALTRQAALVVLQTLAQHYSPKDPSQLLACVPVVLSVAKDPNANVRMSALACLAPLVKRLGVRLVPLLKALAECALGAARSACDASEPEAAEGDGGDKTDKEDDSAGVQQPPAASLQLPVSLAMLDSMLVTLGPFLKPYLPSLLSLLTHPRLISQSTSTVDRFASDMRERLPSIIPPRLLLEPLFGTFPSALSSGQSSATHLLALVEHTCSSMDPKTATNHHQVVFDFLLTALDVRESSPSSVASPCVIEDAAVKALVALVMKLSEKTFKPLYLRLVEWGGGSAAAAAAAVVAGSPPSGRLTALFSASASLGAKLRSVFVPYFRYILDSSIQYLAAANPSAAPAAQPKKKRKHLSQDAAADAAASPSAWVLRTKIIRALHRCFLHDMDGFLDAERFQRLLPPLVTQLEVTPSPDAVAAVEEQCVDSELDAGLVCGSGVTDLAGGAVVRCLVQMAVTAGSDVMWKPLNHQVLMASRSGSSRTRLLALEVVAGLVEKLREEYLILLPETLPFLAELMEDVGTPVEVRTQEVLKLLEEISGEKLDQYLV